MRRAWLLWLLTPAAFGGACICAAVNAPAYWGAILGVPFGLGIPVAFYFNEIRGR